MIKLKNSEIYQGINLDIGLCQINNISFESALERVRLFSASKEMHYVVTPNIDHLERLLKAGEKSELAKIYRSASLSLCDSKILQKILRILSIRVEAAIPGSTLTEALFDRVITKKDSVLIVGGSDSVIEKLKLRYRNLKIKHINPSMGFINSPLEVKNLISAISDSNCNYIFLAVGSPRQEQLANRLLTEGSAKGVVLCVGASILFLVGKEKRAPRWIQSLHAEWLYRMLQDPRRLFLRYLGNAQSLIPIIFTIRNFARN